MRSVFFHLTDTDRTQVSNFLNQLCICWSDEEWEHAGPIYISFYTDHCSEFDEEEIEKLKKRVGEFPPAVTVMADVSGRIVGYEESLTLARHILGAFHGVAADDGNGLWSLDELLADKPSDSAYFWESSRRHAGLPVPVKR